MVQEPTVMIRLSNLVIVLYDVTNKDSPVVRLDQDTVLYSEENIRALRAVSCTTHRIGHPPSSQSILSSADVTKLILEI